MDTPITVIYADGHEYETDLIDFAIEVGYHTLDLRDGAETIAQRLFLFDDRIVEIAGEEWRVEPQSDSTRED